MNKLYVQLQLGFKEYNRLPMPQTKVVLIEQRAWLSLGSKCTAGFEPNFSGRLIYNWKSSAVRWWQKYSLFSCNYLKDKSNRCCFGAANLLI
jgi:hypothetical protein